MILPLLVALSTLNPIGYVNDFANLFRPETVASLEQTLGDFEVRTGHEIAVVTIDTHGTDETIESYAVKLFEKWGIGKEKQDNGLLLLIARDDREIRIEVGYGLEPVITDIESSRIIREVLTPAFKANDYDGGIIEAVNRLMQKIEVGEPGEVGQEKSAGGSFINLSYIFLAFAYLLFRIMAQTKSWWLGGLLGAILGALTLSVWGIILISLCGFIFDYIISKAHANGRFKIGGPWHGGKGGGGGFGGFGGGSSGGGGASGRW